MVFCSVARCPSRGLSEEERKKLSRHRFPLGNKRLTGKWLASVRKANNCAVWWKPTRNSRICSLHFAENCFDVSDDGHKKLKKNACPTRYSSYEDQNGRMVSDNSKSNVLLESPSSDDLACSEDVGSEPKVCVFRLAHPFSCEAFSSKEEAFTFPASCPNCDCKFKCIITHKECLKHVVCQTPKNSNPDDLVAFDFPEFRNVTLTSSLPNPHSKTPVSESSKSADLDPLFESPRKKKLRAEILYKNQLIQNKNKQLKALRMRNYRKKKQIGTYKNIIKCLKKSNLISTEDFDDLKEYGDLNKEFLQRQLQIVRSQKKRSVATYGPALRTFAVTLHYYSPRAYKYVRKCFNKVLPHPNTISSWYTNLDGNPGFTEEAFSTLKTKNLENLKNNQQPAVGYISLDEMNVMKKIEYDGTKYYGYVNNGSGVVSNKIATQELVFIFVSANEPWKIPLGHFPIASLNGTTKANLLEQCLNLLSETTTVTLSVTFDGFSNNAVMATTLGCDLSNPSNFDQLKTYFLCPFSGRKIFVYYDVCHMFKLVRNFLADVGVLYNEKNEPIEWKFFEDLLEVQEVEGLHLSNKLRTQHIHFEHYKMKVKLATQLLSESVAKAFEVLKELKLKSFPNAGPTIEFVRIFNQLFDIFNSKPDLCIGFKRPFNPESYVKISSFLREAFVYISGLQFKSDDQVLQPVIQGSRKVAFCGFLISIKSLLEMYEYSVVNQDSAVLKEIVCNRFCQDHLEIFFGIIRQHGGHRRNPTIRQFQAAYKKCLVHLQLKAVESGNCLPEETVSLLSCTSNIRGRMDNEESEESEEEFDLNVYQSTDHLYNFSPQELTLFTKNVVTYMAGCVIARNIGVLHCPLCTIAMKFKPVQSNTLLIQARDAGGLITPGEDTVEVTFTCEQLIRQALANSSGRFIKPKYNTSKLVRTVVKFYSEANNLEEMFEPLNSMDFDKELVFKHKINLITHICETFFNIRLYHVCRKSSEAAENRRNFLNKLCDFLGT